MPRRRLALLAAALAVVLAAGGVAARLWAGSWGGPAPALDLPQRGLNLGIQDDQLPVVPLADIPTRLDRLASTGVRVTRVDVLWSEVAPRRPRNGADPDDPAYRFGRYDRIVDGLARRGITTMLNVYWSPRWANGGHGVQWAPDPNDLAAFLAALAQRYDGRRHARVGMFEPWNEPNLAAFLRPQWVGPPGAEVPASPTIYAGLLRAAYTAVKRVRPDAVVVGVTGGPSNADSPPYGGVGILTFLRALAVLRPPMDAYGQHLYPATGPADSVAVPSFRTLPELMAAADRIQPGLPVLITEFGWTTSASPYRTTHVSEAQQAEYLPQAVAALAGDPRVRLAMWFNLQDNPGWPAGLLREDGSEKPSWTAMRAALEGRGSGV
jgi:hypothetical protein